MNSCEIQNEVHTSIQLARTESDMLQNLSINVIKYKKKEKGSEGLLLHEVERVIDRLCTINDIILEKLEKVVSNE